jgi:hypothetical protein
VLFRSLLDSPLLPQLTRLDLSLGCLSDEGVEALLRRRERLSTLQELDVSESFISQAALAELSASGAPVVAKNQRERDDGQRYVAVGE